jgi:hypothetical protein
MIKTCLESFETVWKKRMIVVNCRTSGKTFMECPHIKCVFINDETNTRSTLRILGLYLWSLFYSWDVETSCRLHSKTPNVVNGFLHDSRPLRIMSLLYDGSENCEIVTGVNEMRFCLNLPNRRLTELRFEMKRPLLRTDVLKCRGGSWKNYTSYTNINGEERKSPVTCISSGFWELKIIWGNVRMIISIFTEYSYIFYWYISRISLGLRSFSNCYISNLILWYASKIIN